MRAGLLPGKNGLPSAVVGGILFCEGDDTDRHCQPAPTFFHGNLVHKSPKWGLQTGFFLEFHLVADHEMPSAGKSAVFCAFCGDDPREPA